MIFTVTLDNVTVSAAPQDLFSVSATAKMRILAYSLSQNGQTTVGNYPIKLSRRASIALGSGGTVPTPVNVDPSNTTTFPGTVHLNDTTPATGAETKVSAEQFNAINGNYWQPPKDEAVPECVSGDGFILQLESVSGTLHVSGTVWIEVL